ncbi:MAG: protease modulator HflC [Sphingomonadales bacterium]
MNKFWTIIGTVILFGLGYTSMFQIYEVKQGIVLAFGQPLRIVTEAGIHFKMPWHDVVYLEKRILNLDVSAQEIIALDQKRMVVDAMARFKIVDALKTYQTQGNERKAASQLNNVISSNVREVLGNQNFLTLLSGQRADLMNTIKIAVNGEAQKWGIEVVDVRIKRADLPQANSQAIFQRMQTERQQEAQEARAEGQEQSVLIRAKADRDRTVLIAEAQRDAQILRGEGEGEAVRIFAEAFGKDEIFFEFYRSMEAYKKALGQNDTTMVISPDSEFFKFFGTNKN